MAIDHTLAPKEFFSDYFGNSRSYNTSNYKGWGECISNM